jgi:hypothetical protein
MASRRDDLRYHSLDKAAIFIFAEDSSYLVPLRGAVLDSGVERLLDHVVCQLCEIRRRVL